MSDIIDPSFGPTESDSSNKAMYVWKDLTTTPEPQDPKREIAVIIIAAIVEIVFPYITPYLPVGVDPMQAQAGLIAGGLALVGWILVRMFKRGVTK